MRTTLDKLICCTNPMWAMRNESGAAILRFGNVLDDDATGFMCYKQGGRKFVKCFYFYPNALPDPLPVSSVLEYFVGYLMKETNLDIEYISWSEDVKQIQVSYGTYATTVGSEVVAYCTRTKEGVFIDPQWRNGYDHSSERVVHIASARPHYNGPMVAVPREAIRTRVVNLRATLRKGVYLTEADGAKMAIDGLLDGTSDADVVFIEFGLGTKIVYDEFLYGLLLEAYCQSSDAHSFRNRYRLVGYLGLEPMLDVVIKKAFETKKARRK